MRGGVCAGSKSDPTCFLELDGQRARTASVRYTRTAGADVEWNQDFGAPPPRVPRRGARACRLQWRPPRRRPLVAA